MNIFKSVQCLKNEVRVYSTFDKMVFDPSPKYGQWNHKKVCENSMRPLLKIQVQGAHEDSWRLMRTQRDSWRFSDTHGDSWNVMETLDDTHTHVVNQGLS